MKKDKLKKIAKNVIDLEITALKKLKKSIGNNFEKAVHAIVKCKSKIIVCSSEKTDCEKKHNKINHLANCGYRFCFFC